MASAAATLGPGFQLVSQSQSQEQLPAITLDENGGVAIWDDSGNSVARAGRFAAPQPIANTIQLADGTYRDAGAASIDGQSMVVWLRNDDLWGQRIGADGQPVGDPIYIAFTDSRHTQRIAIAASRDHYLVVWVIQTRLLASVIDANGQILNFAISLTNGDYGRNIERVSAASNGNEFLVAWDASTSEPWTTPCKLACPGDDRDVHAVIVNNDGTPRTETEQIIATSGADPDVASDGRDYLMAWSRPGGGISAKTIAAGFTSASDPIIVTPGRDYGVHAAFDGAAYDLAWLNADSTPTLIAARMSSAGRVIDSIVLGYGGFESRDFDLAARDGRLVFVVPTGGHMRVQTLTVSALPGTRIRAVRH